TVSFSSESRPATEELTYGTGSRTVANARRLAAIKVALASGTIRAYALDYDLSGATGLSRLTKVQEYGRNAVVAADGTVTGMALPATTLSYSHPDAATSYDPGKTAFVSPIFQLTGDLNGDGKIDWIFSQYLNSQCVISALGVVLYRGPQQITCTGN